MQKIRNQIKEFIAIIKERIAELIKEDELTTHDRV